MTPYATSSTPGHPGAGASTREPRERSPATPVVRLRRVGVPRVPAVRLTVTLAFADEVMQGLERSTAASDEPVAGAAAGEAGSAETREAAGPRSRRSARGA